MGISIILDTSSHTDLLQRCSEIGLVIKHLEMEMDSEQQRAVYEFVMQANKLKREQIMAELAKTEGVLRLIWK